MDYFLKQGNEKNMVPCYIVGIRKAPQRNLHHQTEEEGYHIFLIWFDPHLHTLPCMVPTHPKRWILHQLLIKIRFYLILNTSLLYELSYIVIIVLQKIV